MHLSQNASRNRHGHTVPSYDITPHITSQVSLYFISITTPTVFRSAALWCRVRLIDCEAYEGYTGAVLALMLLLLVHTVANFSGDESLIGIFSPCGSSVRLGVHRHACCRLHTESDHRPPCPSRAAANVLLIGIARKANYDFGKLVVGKSALPLAREASDCWFCPAYTCCCLGSTWRGGSCSCAKRK